VGKQGAAFAGGASARRGEGKVYRRRQRAGPITQRTRVPRTLEGYKSSLNMRGEWSGLLQGLGLLEFLGRFLRCHGFSSLQMWPPWAVEMLISNNSVNVYRK
jgi:hypothetical protein